MKYIISGLNPGNGGVPKLLEYLNDHTSENFKLIVPPEWKIRNRYVRYYLQLVTLKIFRVFLLLIRNKELVIIHFQSVGLRTTKVLLENNICSLYLVDNTFFCLKSYNNREKKECLDCLTDSAQSIVNNCEPLNYVYTNAEYIKFYDYLRKNYRKIEFLTLSNTQSDLLREFINRDVSVKALYFLTNDFIRSARPNRLSIPTTYDFVFHGNEHPAKGHEYVLGLAKDLPNYSFFFPFDLDHSPKNTCLNNVTFKAVTWETGLKELVQSAKLVFTPSAWSNTPEAATIKSIAENGRVAVLNSKYGFDNELEGYVLCLYGEVKQDIELINSYIDSYVNQFSSAFLVEYKVKAAEFVRYFEIIE